MQQRPLTFKPVYQNYLWGGHKLGAHYGRSDLPEGTVAESWELTDRPDGMSRVTDGPEAGRSLHELIEHYGAALLGTRCAPSAAFPLLIKILDARKDLSVQVHPNDASAAQYGGEAKTEMWYILDAEPGAKVYCGLRPGLTPQQFEQAVADHRLQNDLVSIPVEKGQAIFVPGGRVHSIASGCLLLEVQQNSNTTYRIYDWGRVGPDGQSRELHLAQALEVCDWEDHAAAQVEPVLLTENNGHTHSLILESPYFRMEQLLLRGAYTGACDPGSFEVIFAVDQPLSIEAADGGADLAPGSSALLPASMGTYQIRSSASPAEVIRILLP